jgi:hypothetical protein
VSLVEVSVEERRPMLRHMGSMAPARLRRQFVETGLVDPPGDAESFAAASPRIAVFRVDEAI